MISLPPNKDIYKFFLWFINHCFPYLRSLEKRIKDLESKK